MHETEADIARLQSVLDRSYEHAGAHLLSIHTPERRLTAQQVVDRCQGVTVLALATVAADGRPLVGAVDGLLYRGEFWFGSSPDSVRFRHLARQPFVSAAHLVGEELQIVVHGRAGVVDLNEERYAEFRALGVEVYGPSWSDWGAGAVYARIEPERVYTFELQDEDRA